MIGKKYTNNVINVKVINVEWIKPIKGFGVQEKQIVVYEDEYNRDSVMFLEDFREQFNEVKPISFKTTVHSSKDGHLHYIHILVPEDGLYEAEIKLKEVVM